MGLTKIHISILFLGSLFFLAIPSTAQVDLSFFEKTGMFKMAAGPLKPGPDLASSEPKGLLAEKGYQINLGVDYCPYKGLFAGIHYDFQRLGFQEARFAQIAGAASYRVRRGFNSSRFGLNLGWNFPVRIWKDQIRLVVSGEVQAGLRGMTIPQIDLQYNPLDNRFVEVTYRSRANTFGYTGGLGGIRILFGKVVGVYVNRQFTFKSRHSIKYSVRRFDAEGQLYESELRLHQYLDNSGYQFGVFFVIGK
jgi:hypothetical protein